MYVCMYNNRKLSINFLLMFYCATSITYPLLLFFGFSSPLYFASYTLFGKIKREEKGRERGEERGEEREKKG